LFTARWRAVETFIRGVVLSGVALKMA